MPPAVTDRLRSAIVGQVRAVFNDTARGEAPVQPSDDAWFPPGSVTRRVHGDVASMMVGGIAALLLQMLHPAVLAGVWDHSEFRRDMIGRLRRTARFIAVTSYAPRDQADAAVAHVRAIHDRVAGTLPDGTAYRAGDPRLLAWVHVTEAVCFLDAWRRYAEPVMTPADQDRYLTEFARVAIALGADPVPTTRAEALALIETMRPELAVSARTHEVARLVLGQAAPSLRGTMVQQLVTAAAIDVLPRWARTMHGLKSPMLAKPAIRAGTLGVAGTLRWAFR